MEPSGQASPVVKPPKPAQMRRPRWLKFLIAGLIVAGLALVVVFGLRAVRSYRIMMMRDQLKTGATDVELIRGWMTVPYIARVYGVPQDILYDSLGIQPEQGKRQPNLSDINRDYFPGQQGEAARRVKAAILAYQVANPSLTPGPGGQAPKSTRPSP